MVGRVEVTLGIDALLPLTEAGQGLLGVVHYLQALLEEEEGRLARVRSPWPGPIRSVSRRSRVG